MITITVNNQMLGVDAAPDTPLLWVLRDHLGMTGTKFGCGMALCGACTVHIDGAATRSCVLPLSAVAAKSITTIEGLSKDRSHAVQKAWLEIDVPQCGYCQSGQIMSATALLEIQIPNPAMPTSTRPCPAIFAAAAPTPESARPSVGQRSCSETGAAK